MHAFRLNMITSNCADWEWHSYLNCWLAHDLRGFAPPWDFAGGDGFKANGKLRGVFWTDFWRKRGGGDEPADVKDGEMKDLIATSLRRLQSLSGSLGPELDEELHQWLNTEGT